MAGVLNVVTVHWRSAQWIDVQRRYLERNADVPWRVFASLNGIDESLWDRFHFAADLDGSHAEKLNELARIVSRHSDPGDRLLFLDGDAFPVRPIGTWFDDLLSDRPLAGVRRDENLGDPQPHPCFCLTTVGFWNEIRGDWSAGEWWENEVGPTTDVGGKVLRALEDRNLPWRPILRTNTKNLHPVWFGVYGHRIYHHGAGFRTRMSRVDELGNPEVFASVDPLGPGAMMPAGVGARSPDRARSAPMDVPRRSSGGLRGLPAAFRNRVRRQQAVRVDRRRDRRLRRDERESAEVFSWIAGGDMDFYLRLDRAARD